MVIDTKEVTSWAKLHLAIVVPVACGLLSWYAAVRWQAAIDHNQTALEIFYFALSAVSGVTAAILTYSHLDRLGFFR
jgi:hypothetical protein